MNEVTGCTKIRSNRKKSIEMAIAWARQGPSFIKAGCARTSFSSVFTEVHFFFTEKSNGLLAAKVSQRWFSAATVGTPEWM